MSFIIKGGGAFIGTSIAGNIQQEVPTFTPADLGSKLTLWLDERDQTNAVIGGNPYMSFWGDQQTSTGPHDMTNVGGFVGPVPGLTINGYAAPNFRRSTPINPTRLVASGSPAWKMQDVISATGYHVFAVTNIADILTNSTLGLNNEGICQGENGWYPLSFRDNSNSPQMTVGHYDTGYKTLIVTGSTVPLNTNVLLETWFDGTSLNACVANGTVESMSATNVDSYTLTNGYFYLGSGNQIMSGSLATILVCNQGLNNTERASVRQYLGNKYGVSY